MGKGAGGETGLLTCVRDYVAATAALRPASSAATIFSTCLAVIASGGYKMMLFREIRIMTPAS